MCPYYLVKGALKIERIVMRCSRIKHKRIGNWDGNSRRIKRKVGVGVRKEG
jgi:hypothetical protein